MKRIQNKIPFKEFLDKSTNLITLFGIFNALFIFSTTMKSPEAASFLLLSFFILSVFVWFELILFSLKSSDGSWKYEMFYYLACMVEIGLVWYFILLFAQFLIMVAIYGSIILCAFLLAKFFIWIIRKYLAKLNDNIRHFAILFVYIVSLLMVVIIIKTTKPAFFSFSDNSESQSIVEKLRVQDDLTKISESLSDNDSLILYADLSVCASIRQEKVIFTNENDTIFIQVEIYDNLRGNAIKNKVPYLVTENDTLNFECLIRKQKSKNIQESSIKSIAYRLIDTANDTLDLYSEDLSDKIWFSKYHLEIMRQFYPNEKLFVPIEPPPAPIEFENEDSIQSLIK